MKRKCYICGTYCDPMATAGATATLQKPGAHHKKHLHICWACWDREVEA